MGKFGTNGQMMTPDDLPQILDGELLPAKRGGFSRRPALGTARGIRRELAACYLEFRRGDLDTEQAKTAGFLLRCLLESIRTDEIERRLCQLEDMTK
jgi:hypothetical protein